VKNRLGLETVYDVDKEELQVLGRRSPELPEDCDDGQRLLEGQLPSWLDLLLDMEGLKALTIEYRLRRVEVSGIGSALAAIVAVPVCPAAWRDANSSAEIARGLGEIKERLEVGSGPFFWLIRKRPGVLSFAAQLLRVAYGAGQAFVGDSNRRQQGGKLRTDAQWLGRRIALARDCDIRAGQDYAELRRLFHESEADKGALVPQPWCTLPAGEIGSWLMNRLGDCHYLDLVVDCLSTTAQNAQRAG